MKNEEIDEIWNYHIKCVGKMNVRNNNNPKQKLTDFIYCFFTISQTEKGRICPKMDEFCLLLFSLLPTRSVYDIHLLDRIASLILSILR